MTDQDKIAAALPATWYADLSVEDRVRLLVEQWQKLLLIHQATSDAVVSLEQAKAKMSDFERTKALCLLCGHKRGQHDPDCNVGMVTESSDWVQCQCAGFILMK